MTVFLTRFQRGSNVLPPHRGGAVPSPMGMGRNGRTDLSRGSTERLPPLSRTVFSLGRPLTGHNWAAPLLIDRTDIQVWTDGSVPSLFGPSGAEVYVACSKCNTSNSLSFSSGPIACSFTAETFALKQSLVWCTSHLMICKFQSVLFLTDSQSALSILSSAPSYLLPESLWNVWSLASSLSSNTTLSFQWVPRHAGLPGNEKADLLAKTGASLLTDAIPCPLPPVIAKVRYSQYRNWRRHISHSHLNFQVPEVSSEELLLSHSIRNELSRLRCHGHSLLLSSCLHRISRKENSDCSACVHPLQDLNHLLDCPASEPLRKSIFGSSLSILDLWSRPWGVDRLLGLRGVPPRPHPSTLTSKKNESGFLRGISDGGRFLGHWN